MGRCAPHPPFSNLIIKWYMGKSEKSRFGKYLWKCLRFSYSSTMQQQVALWNLNGLFLCYAKTDPLTLPFHSFHLKSLPINSLLSNPCLSSPGHFDSYYWRARWNSVPEVQKVRLIESINNTFNSWPPSLVVLAWCTQVSVRESSL